MGRRFIYWLIVATILVVTFAAMLAAAQPDPCNIDGTIPGCPPPPEEPAPGPTPEPGGGFDPFGIGETNSAILTVILMIAFGLDYYWKRTGFYDKKRRQAEMVDKDDA